ncbi:MAG TPA: DUF3631 domain-containing protein [Candidatus Angelobacter sp.]|nr:DUF3631 domain-containing protein [Candidatus Angelobacter sp.]
MGGQLPEEARAAVVELFMNDSTQSHFRLLLSDIDLVFGLVRCPYLSTSNLLIFLNGRPASPWRTWHHGGPMTPIDLARILRPYGISPSTIRENRFLTLKGYRSEDFKPLWKRHLGESKKDENNKKEGK